jgi:hypothetical protein
VRIVASALDDLEARVGDPSRKCNLMLRGKQEVVPSRHHQRRHRDLAEPIHDRPALEQLAAPEDERLGPGLRAPLAPDHFACQQQDAGVVVIRAAKPHQGRDHFVRRDLSVEEAPDQLHRPRAVAALGEDLWRILPRPTTVAACVEQHEVRQAVGIAQRVLEGHLAAERMAQHRPLVETQPLAQRVGVRRQVLPGHGRDGRTLRASIAAMVVEDQSEPIRAPPERQHRVVVCPRPAVHEHQRVASSDDLDEQGHISDRHRGS